MKFGVIQCSRCKRAVGVRLGAKTATCPQCGKKMVLKKVKILNRVNSEKELAKAVMRLNIRFKDGEEIVEQDIRIIEGNRKQKYTSKCGSLPDVYEEIGGRVSRAKGEGRVVAAARELCRLLGEFTENDLREVLKRTGLGDGQVCENYINKLIENGIIYEPKRGVYRCLES